MTKEEIAKQVIKGIACKLEVHERDVTPDSIVTADLGADSLDLVEIVMRVEDDFDIEVLDTEMERLSTVQDWIDLVTDKVNAKKKA